MKCLIAVVPRGGAGFVSDLFEGSIDDITIFKECGIMDVIEQGDEYLVDLLCNIFWQRRQRYSSHLFGTKMGS